MPASPPGPAHGSLAQLRSCYPQAWPPASLSLGVRLWATSPGAPLKPALPATHHSGPVHRPGFAFWHLGSNVSCHFHRLCFWNTSAYVCPVLPRTAKAWSWYLTIWAALCLLPGALPPEVDRGWPPDAPKHWPSQPSTSCSCNRQVMWRCLISCQATSSGEQFLHVH